MAMENEYYRKANGAMAQYGNLRGYKTRAELAVDKTVAKAMTGSNGFNDGGAVNDIEEKPKKPAGNSGNGYVNNVDSTRDAYAKAIEEQNRILQEQRKLAEQQRRAAMDATISANNEAAEKSLREAYVANMLAKRNLPQQMKALGVSGGASETTLTDMDNTYMNNRFGIEEQRNDANAQARAAYNAGVAGDYSQYLTKAYELQGGLADNLARMGAASAVKPTAASRATGYNAKAVSGDNNEAMVGYLTRQYIKEGWSRDQIEKMLRQQGLLA